MHVFALVDVVVRIAWLGGVVAALGLATIVALVVQTWRIERSSNHQRFVSGNLPGRHPDGFYKGNEFTGIGRNWQGKVFDRVNGKGINQFADGQRFPFVTSSQPGLRDRNVQVLRIDYNQPGNPLWVRLIVDEIVQTAPGHYLGKIHVRLPGMVFLIGYFELTAT